MNKSKAIDHTFAELKHRWHHFGGVQKWATVTLISIVGWVLLAPTPVFAHEFKVGILLAPAADGTTEKASFMDGFRLAVDQSPDVSHPPGEEGGDHLGAVDVELIVVEDAAEPDAARRAVLDLVERQGVVLIVADLPDAALEAILDPVATSETLLIGRSSMNGANFPATLRFFNMGEQQEGLNGSFLLPDEPLTATFREVYGYDPSAAATRGYLAARLIDIAVETTGGDFTNQQAFYDALLQASQALLPATVNDALAQPKEQPVTTPPTIVEAPNISPTVTVENANTSPATIEASQTTAAPSNPVEVDEEAKSTDIAQPASIRINWVIAGSVVLIILVVAAMLAYLRRS